MPPIHLFKYVGERLDDAVYGIHTSEKPALASTKPDGNAEQKIDIAVVTVELTQSSHQICYNNRAQ